MVLIDQGSGRRFRDTSIRKRRVAEEAPSPWREMNRRLLCKTCTCSRRDPRAALRIDVWECPPNEGSQVSDQQKGELNYERLYSGDHSGSYWYNIMCTLLWGGIWDERQGAPVYTVDK